jgi:hypothetical protein
MMNMTCLTNFFVTLNFRWFGFWWAEPPHTITAPTPHGTYTTRHHTHTHTHTIAHHPRSPLPHPPSFSSSCQGPRRIHHGRSRAAAGSVRQQQLPNGATCRAGQPALPLPTLPTLPLLPLLPLLLLCSRGGGMRRKVHEVCGHQFQARFFGQACAQATALPSLPAGRFARPHAFSRAPRTAHLLRPLQGFHLGAEQAGLRLHP